MQTLDNLELLEVAHLGIEPDDAKALHAWGLAHAIPAGATVLGWEAREQGWSDFFNRWSNINFLWKIGGTKWEYTTAIRVSYEGIHIEVHGWENKREPLWEALTDNSGWERLFSSEHLTIKDVLDRSETLLKVEAELSDFFTGL